MKTPKLQLNNTQRYVLKHLNLSQWYLKDILISNDTNQKQINVIDQLADNLLVSKELSPAVNNAKEIQLETNELRVTDLISSPNKDNSLQNIADLIDEKTIVSANPRNKHLLVKPLHIDAEAMIFTKKTSNSFKLEVNIDDQFNQLELAHQKIAKDYHLSVEQITLNTLNHCDEMIICHQANDNKLSNPSLEQRLLSQILSVCNIDLSKCNESYFNKSIEPQFSKIAILTEHLKQEIAKVNPKRLWLFGGEIAQHLLNVDYPLGHLMQNKQTIKLICSDKENLIDREIELLVFPDLNYLLSIPKDKALVWYSIKNYVLS